MLKSQQSQPHCPAEPSGHPALLPLLQSLGFSNVTTVTRMTVIKLASGGLWVHAPVAPTGECLHLLRELDAPIEYIVLPTFAYEHKVGQWHRLERCNARAGVGGSSQPAAAERGRLQREPT